MITRRELGRAFDALRLSEVDLCIHSSMGSFGEQLERGPEDLVETLLARGCTIMVPTFSSCFLAESGGDETAVFHPECKDLSVEKMGILSSYILQAPGRIRGNHPLNSFAALGPHAEELVNGQTPRDVYDPFRQLCNRDGFVLLAGVSLDRATIVHYAEQLAGRRLFVRRARTAEGTIPAAVGGCSRGFNQLAPVLEPLRRAVAVGQSKWSCFRAQDMVAVCKETIQNNPYITHCGAPLCSRCSEAVKGGPPVDEFLWNS